MPGSFTDGMTGVCAGICAWNGSHVLAAWKMAPAMAAGNTFVLKPSEKSPLSLLAYGDLLNKVSTRLVQSHRGSLCHCSILGRRLASCGTVSEGSRWHKIQPRAATIAASGNDSRLAIENPPLPC